MNNEYTHGHTHTTILTISQINYLNTEIMSPVFNNNSIISGNTINSN